MTILWCLSSCRADTGCAATRYPPAWSVPRVRSSTSTPSSARPALPWPPSPPTPSSPARSCSTGSTLSLRDRTRGTRTGHPRHQPLSPLLRDPASTGSTLSLRNRTRGTRTGGQSGQSLATLATNPCLLPCEVLLQRDRLSRSGIGTGRHKTGG